MNVTQRYTNASAFREAIRLLGNDSSLSKLVSLVKGRQLQERYQYERYDLVSTVPKALANYVRFTVTKVVSGSFDSEDKIPEEFKSKAVPPSSLPWYASSRYSDSWYFTTKYSKWRVDVRDQVATKCSFEDTLVYKDENLSNGLQIQYSKTEEIDWEQVQKDVVSGALDLSAVELEAESQQYSQFSKDRFHPPPSMSDVLTTERKAEMVRLCVLFDIEIPENMDVMSLWNLVCKLENKLFLSSPIFKVDRKRHHKPSTTQPKYSWRPKASSDKKDTFVAEYQTLATDVQRAGLPKSVRAPSNYAKAVKLIAILRGRMKNVFTPAVSATALMMDKTGLATFHKQSADHATAAFVVLLMGSMSYQKLFTIDSQMHGGIDQWLKAYLDLLETEHLATTDFGSIFLLVPCARTLSHVPHAELIKIYNSTLSWLRVIAQVFKDQWGLGVNDCVKKNMMVPRSGTTEINVNAWNACAGAWGSLTRYIRIIESHLGKDVVQPVQVFKVLKLTAADQMSWAECAGKSTDADCDVFKTLTLGSEMTAPIMPWDGLDTLRDDFVSTVEAACAAHSVQTKKWLSGPVERTSDVRADVISVCGVVVQPASAELLKELGAFGAHPFGTQETDVETDTE